MLISSGVRPSGPTTSRLINRALAFGLARGQSHLLVEGEAPDKREVYSTGCDLGGDRSVDGERDRPRAKSKRCGWIGTDKCEIMGHDQTVGGILIIDDGDFSQ